MRPPATAAASADARRLRRDVVWNLVPVVLLGAVGLGLNFVIAAWWNAAALAVFNLVTTAVFAFAVVGACGLQFAVLRAVAEATDGGERDEAGDVRDRVAAIVVGALVPAVVLAAAATGLFLAVRGPVEDLLGHEVAVGMAWAAPGVACFALNKVLLGVVNGLRRMRAFAIYTSLRYLLIAGGLAVARGWHVDADHLAGIWTLTEGVLLVVLLGELVATVAVTRGLARMRWMPWARAHLDYGARGVIATLAYELNSKLDVWMLGAAGIAKSAVGIYSLAAALNEGAGQLAVVLQNNLNPTIAAALAGGRTTDVETIVRRNRRWFVPALAAACALGALAFPLVIPRLVGDPAFAAGAWPFAILMAGLVVASPYLPFNQILLMASRPGWHAVLVVLVLAINFVGDLLLIPPLGPLGAATATAIAVIGSAVLVRRLARTKIGVRI